MAVARPVRTPGTGDLGFRRQDNTERDDAMAISAQEAQGFQFGEGRKGYDERQVESFRQRVVDTLRAYESELARANDAIAQAKERVQELEDAEEAVKRTFLAASRTKREMEEEAKATTGKLLAEAQAEADKLSAEAAQTAEQARADAQRQADELLASAHHDAEAARTSASAEAQELVAAARQNAAAAEAKTATEVERLERRLAQLRTAVGDLERRLRTFASGALDEVAVVSGLIDLEAEGLEQIEAFQRPDLGEAEQAPQVAEQEPAESR